MVTEFNVITYDFNRRKFVSYNIIPYLIAQYNRKPKKPKTFDEFKNFINAESQYQFWSRCQYEIILVDWPNKSHEEKWDVYKQILMNLDTITYILMMNV